jgi:hypothetical protein
MLTEHLLQGHTELYRSYSPQPDIPRPDHLLPSAAVEAKRARKAAALHSSESTEGGSPLAETGTEGEVRKDNSPEPAVELATTLPPVPQGCRVVRKRKVQEVESSRYRFTVLTSCRVSIVLCSDSVHLYSSCSATRDRTRRGGNRSIRRRGSDHCRGGDRPVG